MTFLQERLLHFCLIVVGNVSERPLSFSVFVVVPLFDLFVCWQSLEVSYRLPERFFASE